MTRFMRDQASTVVRERDRLRLPGQRLEAVARDAVLLADPHRLEPAAPDIVPDGPDVKTEPFGYLIYRIQLIYHA